VYGFRIGTKFDLIQFGVNTDKSQPVPSPGIVATLRLMNYLAEQGVTLCDFLRGGERYKDSLATEENRLVHLQV
jgi:CelD/BcsL family acetyltransferase involved in cellulose biosynthesis